ncbi:uncharacterized protein LOC115219132 [Argonauta hians]
MTRMSCFPTAIALCVLLATGLAGAQDFVSYCSKCSPESESSGMYPHPNRCDQFIHCYRTTKLNAVVKSCIDGTLFDEKLKVCQHAQKAACSAKCTTGETFKSFGSCSNYYECVNGLFSKSVKSCAVGQSFNEKTSSCVPDNSCPVNQKVDCTGFRLGAFPGEYYMGSKKMMCAANFAFNMTLCSCVEVMSPLLQKVCTLIDAPMTSDFNNLKVSRAILSRGAKIQNGAAYFDGSAHVVIPAFGNNDFGNKIQIDIDFYLDTPNNGVNSVPVLNNGNCDLVPTLSIELSQLQTSTPVLRAAMKLKGVQQLITLETDILPKQWVSITFKKNGQKLSLWKDNTIAAETDVAGCFFSSWKSSSVQQIYWFHEKRK